MIKDLKIGDKIYRTEKYTNRINAIGHIVGETKTQFKCQSGTNKFSIKKDSGLEIGAGFTSYDKVWWRELTEDVKHKAIIQSLENEASDILYKINNHGLWQVLKSVNIAEENLKILISESKKFLNILNSYVKK